jgi:hypothetical protein
MALRESHLGHGGGDVGRDLAHAGQRRVHVDLLRRRRDGGADHQTDTIQFCGDRTTFHLAGCYEMSESVSRNDFGRAVPHIDGLIYRLPNFSISCARLARDLGVVIGATPTSGRHGDRYRHQLLILAVRGHRHCPERRCQPTSK